jgi:hypothetical protein
MASSILRVDEAIIGEISASTWNISNISRSKLMQDVSQVYEIPISSFRVWDAFQTSLGAAGNDDLGVATGTFGSNPPYITTGDVKNVTNTSRCARVVFTLPPEYDDGETVTLRLHAGMLTTNTASVSATIDAEAYEINKDSVTASAGSDLVTTSATTMNSGTLTGKDFTITPTGLVAGDALDIKITIAINDAQTNNAITGTIPFAEMILDIRG